MNHKGTKTQSFPEKIANLLSDNSEAESFFEELMPVLGEFLQCDRCFLYLRNPQFSIGRVPFCWVRSPEIPNIYDETWKLEPEALLTEDPMFAAAAQAKPSIFVEDVETASPEVLNRDFERENFGHRALIHAHLCQDGQLWGILQCCIFAQARTWTQRERKAIEEVVDTITPIAVTYVFGLIANCNCER